MSMIDRKVDAPTLQIIASSDLMQGALLILGRSSGPLPKSGSARVRGSPGALGVFRLDFWPYEPGYVFLAAVRLPPRAEPAGQAELILRGARASDRDISVSLSPPVPEAEFGRHLATFAQPRAASVVRFLFDLMQADDDSDRGPTSGLLDQFLSLTAKHDGCIELVLSVGHHCIVLQGWGASLAEPIEIVTTQPFPARLALHVGGFERHDVEAPSTGCVLVLPSETPSAAYTSGTVFLLCNDQLIARTVIDGSIRKGDEATGQLRHLLARLRCAPSLRSTLKAALHPRYNGDDTINQTPRRLRAAVDQTVGCEQAGLYLSGWLFDPDQIVACVEFCTSEALIRLDDQFVRIERPDVSQAFPMTADGRAKVSHDWGFAVQVAVPFTGSAPHLRFTLTDDEIAFLPLRVADANTLGTRESLRQSVDLHKPSGLTVIEQCLAPFISRLPPLSTSCSVFLSGPLDRAHGIVVLLPAGVTPRSVIASALQDPLETSEQLILVCDHSWDRASLLQLKGLVNFYQVPCSILVASGVIDATVGLQAAKAASEAADFLLLCADAGSFDVGLRKELRKRLGDFDVICPTVLYEDHGVRFEGEATIEIFEQAPYARARVACAGWPTARPRTQGLVPMKGGSVSCAMFTRRAIGALPPSSRMSSPALQEAALFSALAAAGLRLGWLPGTRVVAPSHDDRASIVSSLIDGWILRATSGGDKECAC